MTFYDAISQFKLFFKDDLIGFLRQRSKPHNFRVATSGGYGIKMLLELKHGVIGKVTTTDMDLTVTTRGCSMTAHECLVYWTRRLDAFIRQQASPHDFTYRIIDFKHSFVPVMNFYRDYVIMIAYKGGDFVDIAITNQRITMDMLDKATSFKAGIPLKSEEQYLKEVLKLIYMETVPGVNEYSYKKRNPVTGVMASKGVKDIQRSKLLCAYHNKEEFKKYCNLLKDVTISKLKNMPQTKREEYFESLRGVVSPYAASEK